MELNQGRDLLGKNWRWGLVNMVLLAAKIGMSGVLGII